MADHARNRDVVVYAIVFLKKGCDVVIINVEADDQGSVGKEVVVRDVVGVAMGADDVVDVPRS